MYLNNAILCFMINEGWNPGERKEKMSNREMVEGLAKFAYTAWTVIDYAKRNEGKIDAQFNNAFEQMGRNPSLFREISANMAGDIIGNYQDEQLERTKERTKIHQKTGSIISEYQRGSAARKEAEKDERQAAQTSAESLDTVGSVIKKGMEDITRWLNSRA